MTTKYGMFTEHQYLKPNAPTLNDKKFVHPEPADVARESGLNFKATIERTGKNNDATFDKFMALSEGDKFVDPAKRALMDQKAKKAGNTVDAPFKTISPMKKSSGLGGFYGTLEGKVAYVPGATVSHQKKKGEIPSQPKGLYTSPAKKGTYGMNKTTLSERQAGYQGVATEYKYEHEPIEIEHQRQLGLQDADRKARVSELPFKPANPPKRGGPGVPNTTISKGKGIAGEWEYILGAGLKDSTGKKSEAAAEKNTVPFKPASLTSKTIGSVIEYIHDPEGPKLVAESARKMAESKRIGQTGAWKPNQNAVKTDMVRSIIRMNI